MNEQIDPSRYADLRSIGNTLKAKREENAYTLEHVSEITRITLTNLRNIESGDIDALPGLVFVRGFIRNYAKLLGLESDWMIEALNQAYNDNDDKSKSNVDNIEDEPIQKQEKKLSYIFSGVAFVIVVGLLIYGTWGSDEETAGIEKKTEMIQAVETPASDSPGQSDQIAPSDSQTTQDKVVKAIISPLNLVLIGKSSDWIRLAVDNKEPIEIRLKEGEKYEWPADSVYELTMTTGNTAKIHLNGEEIEIDPQQKDRLFKVRLNKFSLTRLNN